MINYMEIRPPELNGTSRSLQEKTTAPEGHPVRKGRQW